MNANSIDGKAIAEDIYSSLAPKFGKLARPAKLGIVVVGANPIIESFVRIKTRAAELLGVEMVRINVSEKSDSGKIEQVIQRLVANTDAVIVQLPLPPGIDVNEVLPAVAPSRGSKGRRPK